MTEVGKTNPELSLEITSRRRDIDLALDCYTHGAVLKVWRDRKAVPNQTMSRRTVNTQSIKTAAAHSHKKV